jgi:hypothetical protein
MRFPSLLRAIALALVCSVATGAQEPIAIQPFTIRVSDPVLADLRARLARARIPEPLQGDGWRTSARSGSVEWLRRTDARAAAS